jgi:hypothetical protein
MCRLPFCFFCGKAKEGPRGSEALGIAAQSPAAQTTSIEEKFPLRQRQKKCFR